MIKVIIDIWLTDKKPDGFFLIMILTKSVIVSCLHVKYYLSIVKSFESIFKKN